jgi:hypothetical protein
VYDVQEYFLGATEGLVPGGKQQQPQQHRQGMEEAVPVVKAFSDIAAAPTTASEDDAGLAAAVQAAAGTAGGTYDPSAYADNPWFFYAKHPGLQAPGSRTDKIYVATKDLAACSLCGVTDDAGGAVLDGPGLPSCTVSETCEAEGGAGGQDEGVLESLKGQPEFARMWVTERGAALPNTTIAIVHLKAAFTPGRTEGGAGEYTTVSDEQVAAALNATIRALGLPTRFHLKVERTITPETMDPMFGPEVPDYLKEGSGAPARKRRAAMRAAQRRRLQELGEVEGEQECGRSELFKAYVVSDWKNVTDAVARGIRSSEAEHVLTQLLQERADADAAEGRSPLAFADDHEVVVSDMNAVEEEAAEEERSAAQPPVICTLVAYRTASLHIPSTSKAGVSNSAWWRTIRGWGGVVACLSACLSD